MVKYYLAIAVLVYKLLFFFFFFFFTIVCIVLSMGKSNGLNNIQVMKKLLGISFKSREVPIYT